jgi:hypothetical protein
MQARWNWLGALMEATGSEASARSWLDIRFQFTSLIAGKLSNPFRDNPETHVVYAVWLAGNHGKPVYIGQSADPFRRLNDLPIGESHHLSNSFPPEIWQRVLVVDWERLIPSGEELGDILDKNGIRSGRKKPLDLVGLGIEFHLQREIRPMFNARKKARGGGWREIDFGKSKSLGAKVAGISQVTAVAERIRALMMGQHPGPGELPAIREVFPRDTLSALMENRTTP